MSDAGEYASERGQLENLLGFDLRILTAESDGIVRLFAGLNNLSTNDFRALILVLLAEARGSPLSAGELRVQMGLSGAAITYLTERMTVAGYFRREAHPTDRRKTILRCGKPGMQLAHTFELRTNEHNQHAFQGLSDSDLEAAHRTFAALLGSLHTARRGIGVNRLMSA